MGNFKSLIIFVLNLSLDVTMHILMFFDFKTFKVVWTPEYGLIFLKLSIEFLLNCRWIFLWFWLIFNFLKIVLKGKPMYLKYSLNETLMFNSFFNLFHDIFMLFLESIKTPSRSKITILYFLVYINITFLFCQRALFVVPLLNLLSHQ